MGMYVLRPDGSRRLEDQLVQTCTGRRCVVLLAPGPVRPEALEPFALLDRILGDTTDTELRLVATDGWPEPFWETECGAAIEASNYEGTIDLRPSADQRRRALTQRVEDGRLEVLLLDRGRIAGSTLTLVARTAEDAPIPLNAKLAALELLESARDALQSDPRIMQQLLRDAREALGVPAGRVTSIAQVRGLGAGSGVRVGIDAIGDGLRAAAARPTADLPDVPPSRPQPTSSIRPARRGPGVTVTEAAPRTTPPAPTPSPAARPAPVSGAKMRAEDRHSLDAGRCTQCNKTGAALDGPCGKPELGRFGLIELD